MTGEDRKRRRLKDLPPWMLPTTLAILTLALFGDSLIVPGRVPTSIGSDLRIQLLPWREFAFSQILHGHFPLWNPHAFCGTPFFGDPQSAMLYPPNWLNLFLSPTRAASWLIAVHFFMAAYFTGVWCRRRQASVAAAGLGGILYACCGPITTNIAAGHLPLLCSAAWAPLLFCCVESAFSPDPRHRKQSILMGIPVVAMLALDGYPQFAYYSALAAGLYAMLLLPGAQRPGRTAASVAIMFVGGWAIAAAQIFASIQFAGESVRAAGLTLSDASAFALPPENFLTLLIPGLFGDAVGLYYYGRWFWWETCLFIGPAAMTLALCGLSKDRRSIVTAVLAAAMMLLALGAYTPLFPLLFHYLPGFNSFRATARFGLLGILFLSVLAAGGWDRLEEWADRRAASPHPRRSILIPVLTLLGLMLALTAIYASRAEATGPGVYTWLIHALAATHQSFELAWRIIPTFPAHAASFAAVQLAQAALVTLVTAGLLASAVRAAAPRRGTLLDLVAIVAAAHVIYFAVTQRTSSDHDFSPRLNWLSDAAALPPDARVLATPAWFADQGPADGFLNITGYNPLLLGRTAGYITQVEALGPGEAGQNDPRQVRDRLCRLLRGALVLPGWPAAPAYALPNPLPHLLLMDQVNIVAQPNAALAAVVDDSFDPAHTVVLESPPNPSPQASGPIPGHVRLLRQTSDELEITADVPTPQVLLITDAYSTGWRAMPIDPGDQRNYQVMPADYLLRAIPLAAGHHHFLLEYRPPAVEIGEWISLIALALYLAAAITIN